MKTSVLKSGMAAIMLMCFLGGKSQGNNNVPKPTRDSTVYDGVFDQACAVEVAFGSYGSGIDGAAAKKVQGLIDAKKLKFTTRSIGREGEFRYCLPLTELNRQKRKRFIGDLKKIAKQGQLVSISIR